MAKENLDNVEGVWRTVGGRKIFIRNGQSLADAMVKSGKFKKEGNMREGYRRLKKRDLKSGKNKDMYEEEKKDKIEEDTPSLREEYRRNKTREDYRKAKLNDEVEKKISETETNTEHDETNDSLARYTDKDGKLKPEREEVHRRIIEEYFEGKTPVGEGEEKLYYMTGGGSGTGKSRFVGDTKEFFGKNVDKDMIKIDADDIKAKLYLYGKEMNGDKRRFSASYLHEESSALSKRINSIATDMNYHTMLDSTGDGTPEKLKGKIDDAHNKGYKVVACYGTCSYEKALNNNLNRYIEKAKVKDVTARYVKEKDVVDLHRSVTNTLVEDAKYFDRVDLYDMNDFSNIKKIASGGNGKGLVIDKKYQKEYDSFINKGKLTDKELKQMAKEYRENVKDKLKRRG